MNLENMRIRTFEMIFSFLLVVSMQSVYMKIQNVAISLLLTGATLGTAFLLVLLDCRRHQIVVPGSLVLWEILFLIVPLCQILFFSAINLQAIIQISILFVVLSTLIVIFYSNNPRHMNMLLDDVCDSIFFVNCFSLFFYIFGQVLHVIKPTGSVTMYWGGIREVTDYFFLLFTPQGGFPYHAFLNGRYTGIYTEAPMISFMLCSWLIVTLFISRRKISLLKVCIVLFSVYVTASATGYIVTLLALAGYVFFLHPKSSYLRIMKFLFSFIVTILAGILVISIYGQKQVADVGSVDQRNGNFQDAVSSFSNSPVFGMGLKSDRIGLTTGNTSVFTQILQDGGILLGIWYFLPFLLAAFFFWESRRYKYLYAIGLYLLMLYVTSVTYTSLSVCIISLLFCIIISDTRGLTTTVGA